MKNNKLKIKKGDKVLVLVGKDKGKKGKVLRVVKKDAKVVVEGINIIKKHQRPSQSFQGGIVDKPAPISVAKLMLICPRCNKATRVAKKQVDKKYVRACKKCKEIIDKV